MTEFVLPRLGCSTICCVGLHEIGLWALCADRLVWSVITGMHVELNGQSLQPFLRSWRALLNHGMIYLG